MYVNVKGGTNGGWRSLGPAPLPWFCPTCGRDRAAHWVRCPECGHPRPS